MSKVKIPPLIIERIADDTNLGFLSVIEFRRTEYFGIIDNITHTHVKAYTFENIRPDAISVNEFISTIIRWYYSESYYKPLSVSLSRLGLTSITAPLYKNFELNGVSRIVGNPFMYSQFNEAQTKKKKIVPIPEGIPITLRKIAS